MMKRRDLRIGRWAVEFYFAEDGDGYDIDELIARMYDNGAGPRVLRRAYTLMDEGAPNTGFTFSNALERFAIVAIGPTTSGKEFLNTLVHELHHLAVAIAQGLGLDLEGEPPAYLVGDTALALAEEICKMGCDRCREEK